MSFRFIRRVVDAIRRKLFRPSARLTPRWVATDRLFALRHQIEGLEDRTVPTAISWTGNAGNGLWVSPTNWSTNSVPGPSDDVTISTGNPTVLGPRGAGATPGSTISIHSLTMTTGVLDLQGNLTLAAASTVASVGTGEIISDTYNVTIGGPLASSLTLGPFGTLVNNNPGTTLSVTVGSFTNNGALTALGNNAVISFTVPTLTNYVGSTLTGGSWEPASGGIILLNNGSGITTLGTGTTVTMDGSTSHFYSTGTTNALANLANVGSGSTFTVQNGATFTAGGAFNNAGTVFVASASSSFTANSGGTSSGAWNNAGTLTLGGSTTFNSGSSFTGGGSTSFSSGTQTINTNLTVPNLTVNAGVTISVADNKTFTISGTSTLKGGTLQPSANSGQFANSGTLTHNTAQTSLSAVFTNLSGATFNETLSSTAINSSNGGVLVNASGANFNANFAGGTITSYPLQNAGTATVGGSTDFQVVGGRAHSGTWSVGPGGKLTFNSGGTTTFNTGTGFSGAGTAVFSGTDAFNADVTIATPITVTGTLSPASGKTLTLAGATTLGLPGQAATLGGAGTVALNTPITIALSVTITGNVTNNNTFTIGDGTTNVTNNPQLLLNSGTFTNAAGATLNLAANVGPAVTGSGAFDNFGLVEATLGRAGDHLAGFSVNNYTNESTGEFRSAASGVEFDLPATGTSSGAYTAVSGATLNIQGGTMTLNSGTSFGGVSGQGTGTLQINSGTFHVAADISGTGLSFVSGSAAVNIDAGKTWTLTGSNSVSAVGLANGGSSFTGTLANTGVLAVTGSLGISYGTIDNTGTINVTGSGNIGSSTNTLLHNEASGTINLRGTNNNNPVIGSFGQGTFTNDGALVRDTDTGLAVIGQPYSGSGTISEQTGTLQFQNGGTFSAAITDNAALVFTNGSTNNFNAGVSFGGTGTVQFGSGSHNINTDVTVPTPSVSAGTLTVASGKTFTWTGSSGTWGGGTITGAGKVSVQTGATMGITAGNTLSGTLEVAGTVTHTGTGGLNMFGGTISVLSGGLYQLGLTANTTALSGGTVTNAGTVRQTTNQDLTVSAAVNLNGGTLQADAGTLRVAGGGTWTGGTLNATGTLRLQSNMTWGGTYTGTGTGVQFASGTITSIAGPGPTLNFPNGAFTWAGGVWSGPVTNAATGYLLHTGGTMGGTLTNQGTFTAGGPTVLSFSSGGVDNSGTFLLALTTDSSAVVNGTGSFTNRATGTIRQTANKTLVLSLQTLDNAGTLEVDAGRLDITATISQMSGNTLTGGTWIARNATLNFPPGVNILTLGSGATAVVDGNSAALATISQLRDNQGSFTVANTTFLGAAQAVFSNSGTLTIDNANYFQSLNLGFTQTGGSTVLKNGGLLQMGGNATFNAGTVVGSGTVDAITVTNNATFAPGFSPGIIHVTGNYVQGSAGVLNVEVQGSNDATPDFDQLLISGTATLAGTLNVTLLGGYLPPSGTSYRILTYTSHTGDFGTKNLATRNGVATFTTSPQAAEYDLGGSVFVVTNTADSGGGSLRDAMTLANASGGYIAFNILPAPAGAWTITPLSALPAITKPVSIDGTTEVGYAGTPLIEIRGDSAGAATNGFSIGTGGAGSSLAGLVINRFTGSGVMVQANSVHITGSYIGTDATGTLDRGNSLSGVYVYGANSVVIGTDGDGVNDAAEGNLISGNDTYGVFFQGSSSNNVVAGNRIGTNAAGTGAIGNTSGGINFLSDAGTSDTRIGTNADGVSDALERNVVSGNLNYGIVDFGIRTVIAGNYVGVKADGSAALANSQGGVSLGSGGATVGGTSAAARNVISGNAGFGVAISGNNGAFNTVLGNYIGLNAAGTAAVPNTSDGVQIQTGAHDNTIGGDAAYPPDTAFSFGGASISFDGGNHFHTGHQGGIYQAPGEGSASGHPASVYTVNATTGAVTLLTAGGLLLDSVGWLTEDPSTNSVYAQTSNPGTRIVRIDATTGTQTLIRQDDGSTQIVTSIEFDPVGHRLIAALYDYTNSHGLVVAINPSTLIPTTLFSVVSTAFESVAVAPDGTIWVDDHGFGLRHLDATGATIRNYSITDGVAGSLAVSADGRTVYLSGNDHGFSRNSLRSLDVASGGILDINAGTGYTPLTRIVIGPGGNIYGSNGLAGVGFDYGRLYLQRLDSARNVISGNTINGVSIDGASTRNNVVAGNYIGTDSTGLAVVGNNPGGGVFASGGGGVAITGGAHHNTIGGLTPGDQNVISGNGSANVVLTGSNTLLNVIEGNYIGLNATGLGILTPAVISGADGVRISGGANDNTIGGSAAGAGNVISGAHNYNVSIFGTGSDANSVLGNYIGTDKTGAVALVNNVDIGVTQGASGTIVGSIGAGNVIAGAAAYGVQIAGLSTTTATDGTSLRGNYIGTNPAGAAGLGNAIGVEVASYGTGAVTHTEIGAAFVAAGNVISGNTGNGIDLADSGVSGTTIEGNTIGLNPAGTAALANAGSGVRIAGGSANNTVGGTTALARNVISGNTGNGVSISGAGSTGNVVEGNYIGTDAGGSAALGNADGVSLFNAPGNTIGGNVAGAGNVISANNMGIEITGTTGSDGTVIQGNLIGLDAGGTADLGNATDGIGIVVGRNTVIGGTAVTARNVISGNNREGINVNPGADGTVVRGNYIGTTAAGTAAVGNTQFGVLVSAANAIIGGTASGAGNVISGNGGGVGFNGAAATGGTVQGNYIGTDAAGHGGTLSGTVARWRAEGDATDDVGGHDGTAVGGVTYAAGVTGGQAFHFDGSSGYIDVPTSPTLNPTAAMSIDLWFTAANVNQIQGLVSKFNHSNGQPDDSYSLHILADGTVRWQLAATPPGNVLQDYQLDVNPVVNVRDGQYHHLAATYDGGFMRVYVDGVERGNRPATGAIATTSTPVRLGALINAGSPAFFLNGNLDQTSIYNRALTAGEVTALYAGRGEGTGAGNAGSGVQIQSGAHDNTIGGTTSGARNVISGNAGSGVALVTAGTGNLIEGDYIGTNAAGSAALPNTFLGIDVQNTSGVTIGGLTATPGTGAGNVISGNGWEGVQLYGTGSGDIVQGNLVGLAADGVTALTNGQTSNHTTGIAVNATSNNTIGGSSPLARNVVSGNAGNGIAVQGAPSLPATGNVIANNFIGTDVTGTIAVGNHLSGIVLSGVNGQNGADHNTIGGANQGNLIANNTYYGVELAGTGTDYNLIAGNTITGNLTHGVFLTAFPSSGNGPQHNVIGTDSDGNNDTLEGNVISGNAQGGVVLADAGTSRNVVAGNLIGTNAAGTGAVPNNRGIYILLQASNNTIGGTTAAARNVISGNTTDGIAITTGSSNNVVEGNYIGTTADGLARLPNSYGIIVNGDGGYGLPTGNLIGGTTAGARNIITGNSGEGVFLNDSTQTLVQGNWIGLGAAGVSIGTPGVGVLIQGPNNTIGGTAAGAGNVISGNQAGGIILSNGNGSGNASGNVVAGNFIGTDPSGTSAGGNAFGIQIAAGAHNNLIGVPAAGGRNVISGNVGTGVDIDGATTTANTVAANYIGTNAAGTAAVANAGDGVRIDNGAGGNTIGGAAAGAGNVISGNTGDGVAIRLESDANTVAGNRIGTNAAGTAAVPNVGAGVRVNDAAFNQIGGGLLDSDPALGNLVADNTGGGISVSGPLGSNTIRFNRAYDNTGFNVVVSTIPPGPSAPTITSFANVVGPSVQITGSFAGNPGDTYVLDLYAANAAGEARTYLGSASVSVPLSGVANFNVTVPGSLGAGQIVLGTVTAPDGSTSGLTTPPGLSIALDAPVVVAEGVPVTVTAVVHADNPDALLDYSWTATKNSNPFAAGTDGSFEFTPDQAGSYVVTLTLTDHTDGISRQATATVQVQNAAPVVDLFVVGTGDTRLPVPGTLAVNDTLTLGTAVTDPGTANTHSYQWTVDNGPVLATTPTFDYHPTVGGLHFLRVQVDDHAGGIGAAVAAFVVGSSPAAPTPVFTPPAAPTTPTIEITRDSGPTSVGQAITLHAVRTNTQAGGSLTYTWHVTALDGHTTVRDGTGPDFTFTPPAATGYIVQATATNTNSLPESFTAAQVIEVRGAAAGTVVITRDQRPLVEGTAVHLSAAVPSAPQTPFTFAWTVLKNGSPYKTDTGASYTFTPDDNGRYDVSVSATAPDQAPAAGSASYTVDNAAPAPAILGIPAAPAVVTEGDVLNLSAVAHDPGVLDSPTVLWSVYRGNESQPYLTSSARQLRLPVLDNGHYVVSLTVTDKDHESGTTTQVFDAQNAVPTVAITGGSAVPPVIDPINHIITQPGSVTIDARFADRGPADAAAFAAGGQYEWAVSPTTDFTQAQVVLGGRSFTFTPLTAGDLFVRVTVADKDHVTASVVTQVRVGSDADDTIVVQDAPAGVNTVLVLGLGGNDTIDARAVHVPVVLDGGTGNDTLYGGENDDLLIAGPGDNSLVGGLGNDTLIGGGNDHLEGGRGSDRYKPHFSTVVLTEVPNDPTAVDTIDLIDVPFGMTLDLNQNAGQPQSVNPGSTTNPSTLALNGGFEQVLGTAFGDQFTAAPGATLYGGDGNDTLTAGSPDSTQPTPGVQLIGGSGTDTFNLTNVASPTLYGGDGQDTLAGPTGLTPDGTNTGGTTGGTNTLPPGSGDTFNLTNVASPTLYGSDGGDTVTFSNTGTAPIPGGLLDLGGGADQITLGAGVASPTLYGGDGNDTVNTESPGAVIVGGAGNDTVNVTGGAGQLILGGDADLALVNGLPSPTLYGASGDDTVVITGGGQTTVLAGDGTDKLTAAGGTRAVLDGGLGTDVLLATGAAVSPTLYGGDGTDTLAVIGDPVTQPGTPTPPGAVLDGGTGGDTLLALGGAFPTLYGADGNDTLVAEAGTGGTTIPGVTVNPNATPDTLPTATVPGVANPVPLSPTGPTAPILLGGGDGDTIIASGVSSPTLYGGDGNDTVILDPSSQITLANGTVVNPPTAPTTGALLDGGADADLLLAAGAGTAPTLYGGDGSDTVILDPNAPVTLPGGGIISPPASTTTGPPTTTNALLLGGTGNDVLLAGGGAAPTLYGGDGDDTIISTGPPPGSTGTPPAPPVLVGGQNNDLLIAAGGASPSLYGADGQDTLVAGTGTTPLTVNVAPGGGSSVGTGQISGDTNIPLIGGLVASPTLYGGDGNDTMVMVGTTATPTGTTTGTTTQPAGGILLGDGGNDTLIALAAAYPTLYGGDGNDTLIVPAGGQVTVPTGTGSSTGTGTNPNPNPNTLTLTDPAGGITPALPGGTLYGADGDDTLAAGSGMAPVLVGGSAPPTGTQTDNDTLIAFGTVVSPTLYGGDGSDTLELLTPTPTPGAVLVGGSGGDQLLALGGASPTLYGGDGNDTLVAEAGTVTLPAAAGQAPIPTAGPDSPVLLGGANNDTLIALGGVNPTLYGGDGDDTLVSGGGTAAGTTPSVTPAPTQAPPIDPLLLGGTNNDTLIALAGQSPTLYGGDGNDTLIVGGTGSATGTGGATGDGGTAPALATLLNASVADPLAPAVSSPTLYGGDGNDTLIDTTTPNALLVGDGGNDTLISLAAASPTLYGGDGNDTLILPAPDQQVTVPTAGGTLDLSAPTGVSPTLPGGTLYGADGNDTLAAGSGTGDVLIGGSDTPAPGQTDNDVLIAFGTAVSPTLYGGDGNDTLDLIGDPAATSPSQTTQPGAGALLLGGSGGDVLIALGGAAPTLYGGDGNDTLAGTGDTAGTTLPGVTTNGSTITVPGLTPITLPTAGPSSPMLVGGADNDQLIVTAGAAPTLYGGDGDDTLADNPMGTTLPGGGTLPPSQTPATDALLLGGIGSDHLFVYAGPGANLYGESGNDELAAFGGANLHLFGGSGSDTVQSDVGKTPDGRQPGVVLVGGSGDDSLTTTNTSAARVWGGTGSDFLRAGGRGDDSLLGEEGNDWYEVAVPNSPVTVTFDEARKYGGTDPVTDTPDLGTDVLNFGTSLKTAFQGTSTNPVAAFGTIHIDLSQVGGATAELAPKQHLSSNLDAFLYGSFEDVVGTDGNDTIIGNSADNVLIGGKGNDDLEGGAGNDTLAGGDGSNTLAGGAGNDTYVMSSTAAGTDQVNDPSNDDMDTLDFSSQPAGVSVDLGSASAQQYGARSFTVSGGAGVHGVIGTAYPDTLAGTAGNDWLRGGKGDDSLSGLAGNDTLDGGDGNDTMAGGAGDDWYSGVPAGNDLLTELPGDAGTDTIDLSAAKAGVSLNLGLTTPQQVDSLRDTMTLNGTIENVIGSGFDDAITGNDANNVIIGGGGRDVLSGGGGSDYVQGGETQVVLLDFTTRTDPSEWQYTSDQKAAILSRMQTLFAPFGVVITADPAAAASASAVAGGRFATVYFNDGPAGGSSDAIDFRNLDLGGTAHVNVLDLLPKVASVTNLTDDQKVTLLSASIASHELEHMMGARHADSYGPVGGGAFDPAHPTAGGSETPEHLIASPDSVGVRVADALYNPFVGEREAIKLAFTAGGSAVAERRTAADAVMDLGTLPGVTVPNTLRSGDPDYNNGGPLAVRAISVSGQIDAPAQAGGPTQVDVYSFSGTAGQKFTFEVMSRTLKRIGSAGFDTRLTITDSAGAVLASNDNDIESTDSEVLDVTLPADGTYLIRVQAADGHQSGRYELFGYTAAAGPEIGGGDTMVGGSGQDTLVGGNSPDLFVIPPDGSNNFVRAANPDSTVDASANPSYNPSSKVTGTNNFRVVTLGASIDSVSASPTQGAAVTLGGSATGSAAANSTLTWTVYKGTATSSTPFQTDTGTTFHFTPDDAGTYTVVLTATAGTASSAPRSQTIEVADAAPTATFAGGGSITYGQSATVSFSAPHDGPADTIAGFTYSYSTDGVNFTTGTGPTASFDGLNADDYTIYGRIADQTGAFTPYQTTVHVGQASSSVTVTAVGGTYDGTTPFGVSPDHTTTPGVSASVGGAGTVTGTATVAYFLASDTAHASPIGAPVNAGDYVAVATYAGDTNHTGSSGSASFTVAQAASTTTVAVAGHGANNSFTYDGTAFAATGTVTGAGGLAATPALTYYAGSSAAGTALGGAPTNAGTYTVAAHYAGDPNHLAGDASQTFTISKAHLTVTADNKSRAFGVANPALTYTITGFVHGETAAAVSGSPTLSTNATASSPPGAYTITVGAGGLTATNYDFPAVVNGIPYLVNGVLTVFLPTEAGYVLNTTASGAVTVTGNAVVNLPGGLFVDSSSASAVTASGNATVQNGGQLFVTGGVSRTGNSFTANRAGAPAATADPLSALPLPSLFQPDGTTPLPRFGAVSVSGNATRTLNPGIYTSITISGNASVTLAAGRYIILGGGITVSGNASLTGNGVFVFNAGSAYNGTTDPATGTFGGITLGGNGMLTLNPPTAAQDSTYAGVLIFQSRANAKVMNISGNSSLNTHGTIYAPAAQLYLSGSGQLHDTLVVNTLYVSGNAGAFQLSGGAWSDYVSSTSNQLAHPILTVAAQDDTGAGLDPAKVADLSAAMAYLNGALAQFGVDLSWAAAGQTADVHVHFATTTPQGGRAEGVLGFTTDSGDVYLADGWDLYTGSDPAGIGANQYDFLTLATHELAHTLGLGESGDQNSVGYEYLTAGSVRREFTESNLALINTDADRFMKAAGTTPTAAVPVPVPAAPATPVAAVPVAAPYLPPAAGGAYTAGGFGTEVLVGGAGNDLHIGAETNDVLVGGFGSDHLAEDRDDLAPIGLNAPDGGADDPAAADWFAVDVDAGLPDAGPHGVRVGGL